MAAALYNAEILRLAAGIPHHERLPDADASAEKRSPVCGSRVIVDIRHDGAGRVAALGLKVNACALGQASASLMAQHALGKSAAELGEARDALSGFLAGTRENPGDWPGLEIFTPALPHKARHPSIRLAFEAVAEAAAATLHKAGA